MTVFSGPMDNSNMSQAQWEEVESKLWTTGVITGARNTFTTTTTTGLGISVNTGDAILDGFRFYADAATALTAATADPSLPRIDLLVLRIDEAAHTATIALKTGTPAASPAAPTATQTPGGTYELGIYQVRVNAASTSITSLTDVRTYAAATNAAALTGATFTGAITANGGVIGNVTGNATGLTSDNALTSTAHVSGTAPTQFYLLILPASGSNKMSFGARVYDGAATHDVVVVNNDGSQTLACFDNAVGTIRSIHLFLGTTDPATYASVGEGDVWIKG